MEINNRIKTLRKHLKLTQLEFSNRISISGGFLAQLETSVRDVNDRHIKLICQEFNVNEGWLRTGEGEMFILDEGKDLFFELGKAYPDMDELEKRFFVEYLRLSPDERAVFKKYFMNIGKGYFMINDNDK